MVCGTYSALNRPTGSFALTILGGSIGMISLTYPIYFSYRAIPDSAPTGFIIVILGMLLHEMPERKITFGTAIAAVSVAELISSTILISVTTAFYVGSLLGAILYFPLVGSVISLLGGFRALRWKPGPIESVA